MICLALGVQSNVELREKVISCRLLKSKVYVVALYGAVMAIGISTFFLPTLRVKISKGPLVKKLSDTQYTPFDAG